MLKPSTGYAFERVQRDSAAIVRSLDRHGHPFDLPTPRRRHAWLDRVMLDVVRARPDELDRAFTQMFERNPLARVLRFLDEDSTPLEEARLIATLPPGPFLRAAAGR
jgi:lycopene beta-cyclase